MKHALVVALIVLTALAFNASGQEVRQGADTGEAVAPDATPSLVGDWVPRIGVGDDSYEVILHVDRLETGLLRATGESVDTGATGVESLVIVVEEGSVRMEFDGARFVGDWSASSSAWEGYWRNGDEGIPMMLKRP
jgi:hypothetical protein